MSEQATTAEVPRYPTVHVEVGPDDVDEASAELFALGATGVEERDRSTLEKSPGDKVLLVAHFDLEDQARIAAETLPWGGRVEYVVGDEWKHRWREFFKPSRLGEHVVVRPPWIELPSDGVDVRQGDVVVTIDPGQAFGTGTHETTRLVLAELDRIVPAMAKGTRVLDVGCGSGILSIAAVMLGAERAEGVDVEAESVAATHENAERNGVGAKVKASLTPLARVKGQFPLVVANVESRVLVPFANDIAARVAPGGVLVLSGLLFDEEQALIAAYPGFTAERVTRERDWIAITLRKDEAEVRPSVRTSARPTTLAKKVSPVRPSARPTLKVVKTKAKAKTKTSATKAKATASAKATKTNAKTTTKPKARAKAKTSTKPKAKSKSKPTTKKR
jgi:ribosomal protein L11 methyltransferase